MAERTGESRPAMWLFVLKQGSYQINWSGSLGVEGYLEEAAEIKKRGKCFHTGNMGFPLAGEE